MNSPDKSIKFYYTYRGKKALGKGHTRLESIYAALDREREDKGEDLLDVEIFTQVFDVASQKHIIKDYYLKLPRWDKDEG